MDTKRMIIWTAVATVLAVGWMVAFNFVERTWPTKPPVTQTDSTATQTNPAATQPAGTQPSFATTQPTTGAAGAAGPTISAPNLSAPNAQTALNARLGSDHPGDPTYAMQLDVDPQGAAIRSITLNEFKHPADFKLPQDKRRPYVFQEAYADVPAPQASSLATRSVTISGPSVPSQTIDLSSVTWTREPGDTASAVTYSVTINDPNGPVLRLTKSYTVPTRSDPSLGYEVQLVYGMENLIDQPLTVKTSWNGPTLPPKEQSRPPDRQVMAGYKADTRTLSVSQTLVESFKKTEPTVDLTKKDDHAMEWAGTASTYFAAYVLPTAPTLPGAPLDGAVSAGLIASVTATEHDVANDDMPAESRSVTLDFTSADIKIAAKSSSTLPMHVYFGPRWRKVLDNSYYATFPRAYDTALVISSGPCSFCTFGWLIKGMVLLLGAFQWVAGGFIGDGHHGSWGIAIIVLVVLVRTALHPIMKRSQVQMMKMGQMGPELEKLKKKYGDDKEAFAKAQMQVMKEQGFAPILGCLPMFLQMPIWIALYSALQTTFELRQAPFLWSLTWIKDLSKPDYFINFGHSVPVPVIGWFFTSWHIDGINILPIFMALVFWLQQKYTPKPPAQTPEQAQQQKMMQWMSLLFPVFLYNGPSGLNVYILTSTTIGILEGKIIRDHIKQQKAAQEAGLVIVDDAPPGRAPTSSKVARRLDNRIPPAKPGLMARVLQAWEEFQKKVDADRRGRGR